MSASQRPIGARNHALVGFRAGSLATPARLPALAGLLLLALAPCALAQDSPVTPALAAADDAARAFDYEGAVTHLEKALEAGAEEPVKAALTQRRALYEHFLDMPALVQAAKDDPDRLVGQVTTRGGQQLPGYIRLVELGVTPDARFGERVAGLGEMVLADGENLLPPVKAREIAEMTVDWVEPAENSVPGYWTLGKLRIVLHSGTILQGTASWTLGLSAVAVRGFEDGEDTLVEAYPSFGRDFDTAKLMSQITIIGAPLTGAEETQ